MYKIQLESATLREPLKRFIQHMLKKIEAHEYLVYRTARMGAQTYKNYFLGKESPGTRDRILIACLIIIREESVSYEQKNTLLNELRELGGDTVIVASRYDNDDLRDFLIRAKQRSINRFRK